MHLNYLFFQETQREAPTNNPCVKEAKDFYVMRSSSDDKYAGYGKLRARGQSLERVAGCCNALNPLLEQKMSKTIMDLMKLSIGTTIPRSPKYVGSSNGFEYKYPLLEPSTKLKRDLVTRY